MIIIAGTVDIDPERREEALVAASKLLEPTRAQKGCMAYNWCADSLDPGRVQVYECWENEESLAEHFQNKWYLTMRETMGSFGLRGADVSKFRVDLSEPVYDSTFTPRADFFTAEE